LENVQLCLTALDGIVNKLGADGGLAASATSKKLAAHL